MCFAPGDAEGIGIGGVGTPGTAILGNLIHDDGGLAIDLGRV